MDNPMPYSRFCLDENGLVVDGLALFVLETFRTQENIMDPRFSFYVNRVFKEYLFPRDVFDINEYTPVDVQLLMSQLDTVSYNWLTSTWQSRFSHLRMKSKIQVASEEFLGGCEATCWFSFRGQKHRVTKVVNETLTLSTLHCLAQLVYDTSLSVRTNQYHSKLRDVIDPPPKLSR